MRINVRLTYNSQTKTVTIPDDTQTVTDLKTQISLQIPDLGEYRLVFSGKVMKDEDLLSTIGVRDGVTLHLVRSKAPAKTPAPTAQEPQAAPREPNYYTGPIAGNAPASGAGNAENSQNHQNPNPNPNSGFGGFGNFGNFGMGGDGGIGGFGQMPGNMNEMMNFINQNPQMLDEAINMIAQNPGMIRAMLSANPQTAAMMQNPQMAGMIEGMLSNPQMLRMMLNPQMMQMASSMMGGMGGMNNMNPMGGMNPMNQPQQQPQQNNNNNNNNQTPQNANPFAGLFGMQNPAMGGAQMPQFQSMNQQPMQQRSPQEIYQTQLASLREMGFFDEQENINALQRTGGNVNAAVELLLRGPQY